MPSYLQKHALYPALIEAAPQPDLGLFVVIPCYNEPALLPVLESLRACHAPECTWEVLVVVNVGENALDAVLETNRACFDEAVNWCHENGMHHFHIRLFDDLPAKHAGVGLARKIGMDEAARRLPPNGIIVNLDADCTVAPNYLQAIHRHFTEQQTNGASLHFEHPLEGITPEVENAIVQYELYLRYFINMQRLIGFPWAFQTIGSAMAVRNQVYQKQGGMNRRKAGEDFYFLHKVIELGRFSEINTTTVFASPRKSDRVPFGTGKAVADILSADGTYSAYHPQSFAMLKELFEEVPNWFGASPQQVSKQVNRLPEPVQQFLSQWDVVSKTEEINRFTSNQEAFVKRFFREFNAFQLMKYCHFVRDGFLPDVSVKEAIAHLFRQLELPFDGNLKKALLVLREFDRGR